MRVVILVKNGIYGYFDKKRNKFVYIGKDSYISSRERHKKHLQPSRYDDQPFNRVLQNNKDRYVYCELIVGNFDESTLNELEKHYILLYNTFNDGFNFTLGGDGTLGSKQSKQTKLKQSDAHKKNKNPSYRKDIKDEQIIDLYLHNKKSMNEISKILDCSIQLVRKRLDWNNISIRSLEYTNSGKNNPMYGRLDKDNPNYRDDIPTGRELFIELQNGVNRMDLSKKYGCHYNTIWRRINNFIKEKA